MGRTAAGLLAVLLVAGCSTTVAGRGSGSAAPSPTDFPTSSSVAPPSDTSPPSSSAATTQAPTAAPRPSTCPATTCKKVASADLGGGDQVVLLGDPSQGGGLGVSVLELARQGVAVFWAVRPEETPAELTCSPQPAAQCVAVDYVGAHAALGRVWKVDAGTLVAGPGEAQSATATMHAADLNGDGNVDVLGLQNNYEPDYATGKVYWQTWTSDGSTLTPNGCGPLASTMPPAPTTVLTGTCPS